MKRLIGSLLLLTFLSTSLIITPTFARSGCCSHHGGVAGCGCADGTPLSSTCAPYYPWCNEQKPPVWNTPTPTPIDIQATMPNDYNSAKNEYSIKFDWEDIPGSFGYSTSISKYPGSDPGPITDSINSVRRFNHVKPGFWYLNLKNKDINGWSPVMYWSINLPNTETRTVK